MGRAELKRHESSGIAAVRLAIKADLDGAMDLAAAGGGGLTNLPPERNLLASRIAASERAVLAASSREEGVVIMLVVERGARIVAISGVFLRVGAEWPFYSYRLTRQANRALAVGRVNVQTLLNLVNDLDGEAEIGMLFLDPSMRGGALGTLAVRSRYRCSIGRCIAVDDR